MWGQTENRWCMSLKILLCAQKAIYSRTSQLKSVEFTESTTKSKIFTQCSILFLSCRICWTFDIVIFSCPCTYTDIPIIFKCKKKRWAERNKSVLIEIHRCTISNISILKIGKIHIANEHLWSLSFFQQL